MPTFEWICVSTLLLPPFIGIGMLLYDKLKVLSLKIRQNPCKECLYYAKDNNICHSKKAAIDYGYVNLFDRWFCEPRRSYDDEEF